MHHRYLVITLLLMLPFWAKGQNYQPCSTSIVVADTVVLDDSVRFHLLPFDDVDSVLWAPDSLFANPRAVEQWITLPFDSADRTGRIVFQAENICRGDQFWDPAASRIPAGTYFYRFVGRGINHATQHQGCIEILK